MFIDLDHFKPINDELGHEMGDWLLQAVARRIQGCLRESDTAARLGGDEFVVLLPELQTQDAALAVAEKVRSSLAADFVTDQGVVLAISSSIGVAIYPDHALTDKELLRLGDEAMYQAKKRGRNAVELCRSVPKDPAAEALAARPLSQVRLRWKNAFCCGHPELDQQHQKLFELANALLDATALRHEQFDSFDAAFLQLLSHVTEHFRFEEGVMASVAYPAVTVHAEQHQALVAQAQALYAASQADETDVAMHDKLVSFLVNELVVAHMLQSDRAFFAHDAWCNGATHDGRLMFAAAVVD
jgi:diguanylate cyclase (GGDEF)-like protein/hemerythrin-like metal-binding protein